MSGKRGAEAPLPSSSDEDEPQEAAVVPSASPRPSEVSPHLEHDYASTRPPDEDLPLDTDNDYENVSSPGNSSTASGPTYVRQPGFTQHAHEVVSRPKIKKKKTNPIFFNKDGCKRSRDPTPPLKAKPKRDPLPMRLRALPQSFWQQPNVAHNVSPATAYPVLPPLCTKDTEEDVSGTGDEFPEFLDLNAEYAPLINVRPVTPPDELEEKEEKSETLPKREPEDKQRIHRVSERKITVANTDLLFKLFEGIEAKESTCIKRDKAFTKRGRPRKVVPCSNKSFMSGQDPYLVECSVTEKLFPQLSLEASKAHTSSNGTTLHLVTLREGDKSVTLPALGVEQNYPQMLSELVMHI